MTFKIGYSFFQTFHTHVSKCVLSWGKKETRTILHPFTSIRKLSAPFPVCHNVVFVTCVEVRADAKNRSKSFLHISVSLQSLIMVSGTE